MKKLIALEPEVYHSLTSKTTHEKPEKKIFSELDTKMQEILNSDLPAAEKMQLYNEALQKSKLFQQKTQAKSKRVEKLSDSAILSKVRKKTKARQLLKNIKEQKNLDFDDKGQILLDERVIPGSDINQIFQSVLNKQNLNLPGLHEFEALLWESL